MKIPENYSHSVKCISKNIEKNHLMKIVIDKLSISKTITIWETSEQNIIGPNNINYFIVTMKVYALVISEIYFQYIFAIFCKRKIF